MISCPVLINGEWRTVSGADASPFLKPSGGEKERILTADYADDADEEIPIRAICVICG